MAVLRTIRNSKGEEHHLRIPAGFDDLVKAKGPIGNFTLMSGDTIVVP